MPIVTTQYLRESHCLILERLSALYSLALRFDLTPAEEAEADELRQRALLIHIELKQREPISSTRLFDVPFQPDHTRYSWADMPDF